MSDFIQYPPNSVVPLPCDSGLVSDSYHTFDELYAHRCALFVTLLVCINEFAAFIYAPFKTRKDDQGREIPGWFIAGIDTPYGQITYHLPDADWERLPVREVEQNNGYDGHTAADVIERLDKLRAGWL